jgi:hypothetical protein
VLPNAEVSRLAGLIRATDDYWLISNYSTRASYVVRNPDGGGEYLRVAPRRLELPVPFEYADLVLPGAHVPVLSVLAPRHSYAAPDGDAASVTGLVDEPTTAAFSLDETSRYFLVLVALCEPRLRDAASVVIPTVPEIIEQLARAGHEGLTRAGVNFHIEYLARHKLRVKGADSAGKADWQRAALVSVALGFGLVDQRHLALLSRPAGTSQAAR